eukprot:2134046-Pyramimonas_sp.AAC.1
MGNGSCSASWQAPRCAGRDSLNGMIDGPTCQRCGSVPETGNHRCWGCPANAAFRTVSNNLAVP